MATVLIVEDEDSLRETLCRFLEHEGHDVITAASGGEALDTGVGAEPDVLITDWMLKNHVHGLHVSDVFRGLNPQLSTILITGFPSRDLAEQSDRAGVTRLLEKPFDLSDLQAAVESATRPVSARAKVEPAAAAPIAVVLLGADGSLRFASACAREMLGTFGQQLGRSSALEDVIGADPFAVLEQARSEWVEVVPPCCPDFVMLLRARKRADDGSWLVVFCPRAEEERRSDPRVQLLVEDRRGSPRMVLGDRGPVLVIEREGVVRRLLVSQVERAGALCYASESFTGGLRLLIAEPRIGTVMLECGGPVAELADRVAQLRAARPEAMVVGISARGDQAPPPELGIRRVLHKPWRIHDLIAALERPPLA